MHNNTNTPNESLSPSVPSDMADFIQQELHSGDVRKALVYAEDLRRVDPNLFTQLVERQTQEILESQRNIAAKLEERLGQKVRDKSMRHTHTRNIAFLSRLNPEATLLLEQEYALLKESTLLAGRGGIRLFLRSFGETLCSRPYVCPKDD